MMRPIKADIWVRGCVLTSVVAGLALAAVAATAGAQPMGGGQMPDPRQMSGVPRGEQNNPPGVLTVKAVQGAIMQSAPAGTAIHLVSVATDGTVALQTRPTDADGRVRFEGLATDGSAVYYALATLARGEQGIIVDRLQSRVIQMPPQVGVATVLAGLTADSAAPAVDDLAMPGMPSIDPGTVVVFVGGDTASVSEVQLLEVGSGQVVSRAAPVEEAQTMVARFAGIAPGTDRVYVAQTVVGGRIYRSTPLQLTASSGALASVFAYPRLRASFHAGAEVDDANLWFQIQYTLANSTGAPYDPGPNGIAIPLPVGFIGASVREQDAVSVKVASGSGFVWRGALPPGQRSFVGSFALPIEDGEVSLTMPLPFGAVDSQFAFHHVPGMQVESMQAMAQTRELDTGNKFVVLSGLNAGAGESLRVRVRGLPQPPAWLSVAEMTAGLTVVALVLMAIAGVFTRRSRAADAGADRPLQDLMLARERLYDRLVHVEKQHRAGHLADARFERARAALVAELGGVIAAIREREGVGAGKPAAPRP